MLLPESIPNLIVKIKMNILNETLMLINLTCIYSTFVLDR